MKIHNTCYGIYGGSNHIYFNIDKKLGCVGLELIPCINLRWDSNNYLFIQFRWLNCLLNIFFKNQNKK